MSKQQAPKGPGGRRPLNPQDLKNIGKNSKKTIKRLLGLLRPYRARLALVFLSAVLRYQITKGCFDLCLR